MAKAYVKHDYAVTGRDYVETEGGDTPAGGVDYSTEEVNTGIKWIDEKNIYQKVFEIGSTTVPNNTWVSTTIESTSMAQVIEAWGINSSDGGLFLVNVAISGSVVELIAGKSSASTIDTLVLKYTKTE